MALLRLLLLLGVWMCRTATRGDGDELRLIPRGWGVLIFLGGYVALVLIMRLWAMRLARRLGGPGLRRSLGWFNWASSVARMFVPVWLGLAVFGGLQWGITVDHLTGVLGRWPSLDVHVEGPQLLLGIAPALLAWMALWWAEYPAERASREQNMLVQLDNNLPVHAPPSPWKYFLGNLRLQVLFVMAPILCALALRDVLTVILGLAHVQDAGSWRDTISLPLIALVFVFAPELLRRVLHTERLPDVPLRRKLQAMCRRSGLKYRDVLLWHTDSSMSNAMVMGLFPQVRYILMSDLLLETMTDEQAEAVFAHELGHVVHWHLWWLVAFTAIFVTFAMGPGEWIGDGLGLLRGHLAASFPGVGQQTWAALVRWEPYFEGPVVLLLTLGLFWLFFGYYSRWLERQADVYGARMMQMTYGTPATASAPGTVPSNQPNNYVGVQGAGLFASALRKVASVNQIPEDGPNWRHGSIAMRIRYLHHLSVDPARTSHFDRTMRRLFSAVALALCVFLIWGIAASVQSSPAPSTPSSRSTPAIQTPAPAAL